MATYLFTSPGVQDIKFKKEFANNENPLCGKWNGIPATTLASARVSGEQLLKELDIRKDQIVYPILQPAIQYCIDQNKSPDKIFLIVSNQNPPDLKDTIFIGEILIRMILDEFHIDAELIKIVENPSSFDTQYRKLSEKLSSFENDFDKKEDSFYIYSQTGTPAIRNALLLNCLQRFDKTIQLEKPEGEKVTEQSFPEEFRRQVRINSAPFAIKAYIAQILSRNYVHHIGSHVTNRVFFSRLLNRFNLKLDDLLIDEQKFYLGIKNKFKKESVDNYPIQAAEVFTDLNKPVIATIDPLRYMLSLKDKLDAYCQQRNEYIANLTASPDLSGKTAFLFRDILLPFMENTLILDNIAASEKIYYSNKLDEKQIRLQVFMKNEHAAYSEMTVNYTKADSNDCPDLFVLHYDQQGKVIAPTVSLSRFNKRFDESVWNLKTISGDDIEITLPGTLGAHALYSILENYIRNVTKHDRDKIGNQLDVKVYIEKENEDYYRVCLTNSYSILSDNEFKNLDTNLKKAFKLIDTDGNPIQSGAGILDMAINANLLRGIGEFSNKTLNDSLKINRTVSKVLFPKIPSNVLYYTFFLRKAKNIVCLTNTVTPANLESGIVFTNRYLHNVGGKFAVLDYDLIKDLQTEEIESLLLKLPFRIIIVLPVETKPTETINRLTKHHRVVICDVKELPIDHTLTIEKCWQVWLFKRWGTTKNTPVAQLYLYFEEEGMASKWEENVNTTKQEIIDCRITDAGFDQITQPDELLPIICFDHHGSIHDQFTDPMQVLFTHENSYVLFGKNSSDYLKIAHARNNPNMVFELAEAGLMNVLIVDERIAQVAMNTETKAKPVLTQREDVYLWDYYQAANIWVTTQWNFISKSKKPVSVDFVQKTAIEKTTETPFLKVMVDASTKIPSINYKSENKNALPDRFDLIILHRSVLTDMIGDQDSKEFIDQLHVHFPFVIVNSGGGRPLKVKGHYKFLPYATLSKYFGRKEFAKYSFIQEIMEM